MNDYGRGLKYPQDVYTYGGRKWIGLFHHWQMKVNPLSVLGAVSYILTCGGANDVDHVDSVELAGKYLL